MTDVAALKGRLTALNARAVARYGHGATISLHVRSAGVTVFSFPIAIMRPLTDQVFQPFDDALAAIADVLDEGRVTQLFGIPTPKVITSVLATSGEPA